MYIYIPDDTPYVVIGQICKILGFHDWDKSSSRNKWRCKRCKKSRRAKF